MSDSRIIQPEQLKKRLEAGESLCIIDVREDDEIALGMINGAKHIVMNTIPQRLADIPRNEEVIMVCRSGNRSGMVCEFLEAQGYTNVKNMVGGMLVWENL